MFIEKKKPKMHAGEAPHTGIVASISQGPTTLVYCVEEDRLGFTEGDLVTFSEVQGMKELHTKGPFRVKSVKRYMLELDVDSSGFAPHVAGVLSSFLLSHSWATLLRECLECIGCESPHPPFLRYTGIRLIRQQGCVEAEWLTQSHTNQHCAGGIITQVKEPKQGKHRSLSECLKDHGTLLLADFLKIERPQELHVAFQALDAYRKRHGRSPLPGNRTDIEVFIEEYKTLNQEQVRGVSIITSTLHVLGRERGHFCACKYPSTSFFFLSLCLS
jgi:hypothetical protein